MLYESSHQELTIIRSHSETIQEMNERELATWESGREVDSDVDHGKVGLHASNICPWSS